MKILFVHNRYLQNAGGEDSTVEAETALLRARGHEVRILIFQNEKPSSGIVSGLVAGSKIIYNKASANILKGEALNFQPDIIHVHNFFYEASPSVIIEAKKLGFPVVVTLQNFRLICANGLLLRQNKVCELCVHHSFPWFGVKYKCYHSSSLQSAAVGSMAAVHKVMNTWRGKVDRYITPSIFMKNRLINSSLSLPAEKVSVKRNFVDDAGFAEPSSREPFFLFVGRLSEEKGVEVLLKVFKGIPGLKLILAGEGPLSEDLQNRYKEYNNIKFLGKQNRHQVITLMKQCKALIFPSIWYEGLPLTIIEALSVGTPVIASNLGAMQEMIEDGKSGLLFNPGDVSDLKEKVLNYVEMGIGNYSYHQQARDKYLDIFHPDVCYRDVIKVYESLLKVNAL